MNYKICLVFWKSVCGFYKYAWIWKNINEFEKTPPILNNVCILKKSLQSQKNVSVFENIPWMWKQIMAWKNVRENENVHGLIKRVWEFGKNCGFKNIYEFEEKFTELEKMFKNLN